MIAPAKPDDLPMGEVGLWTRDKHIVIEQYIKISRGARQQYIYRSEATYIDLWCGPGMARIKKTHDYLLGSPIVAYEAAVGSGVPFNRLFISDIKAAFVDAAETRLKARGATSVIPVKKPAEEAVEDVVAALNPHGLHFAVLDPFSLDLPFSIIKKLAQLKRMDLLMLLSTGDLQRNFRKDYLDPDDRRLDRFAPGWRTKVDLSGAVPDEALRQRIVEYWFSLVQGLKFATAPKVHAARNSKQAIMYWLVFASRSGVATDFWDKAMKYIAQPGLDF
jgi:three-Cys-motif partner protein